MMTEFKIDRFRRFVEKLAVNAADSPALRAAKEDSNLTEERLAEYKNKKETLTKLYTDVDAEGKFVNDEKTIKEKVEGLLGQDENKRNTFLVQWMTVLDIERRLKTEQRKESDDKIAAERLRQDISQEMDEASKSKMQKQLDDLNSRMSNYDVSKLENELETSRKAFLDTMSKRTQEFNNAVNKIKTLRPK